MSLSDEGAQSTPVYAVRFTPQAEQEAADGAERLAQITGSNDLALEWFLGVKTAAGALGTNPRRFPVDGDASRKIGRDIRRLLFQRSPGSTAAYHLYFNIEDTGEDGPIVRIIHVRHASRRPMTRKEVREIRETDW